MQKPIFYYLFIYFLETSHPICWYILTEDENFMFTLLIPDCKRWEEDPIPLRVWRKVIIAGTFNHFGGEERLYSNPLIHHTDFDNI